MTRLQGALKKIDSLPFLLWVPMVIVILTLEILTMALGSSKR